MSLSIYHSPYVQHVWNLRINCYGNLFDSRSYSPLTTNGEVEDICVSSLSFFPEFSLFLPSLFYLLIFNRFYNKTKPKDLVSY